MSSCTCLLTSLLRCLFASLPVCLLALLACRPQSEFLRVGGMVGGSMGWVSGREGALKRNLNGKSSFRVLKRSLLSGTPAHSSRTRGRRSRRCQPERVENFKTSEIAAANACGRQDGRRDECLLAAGRALRTAGPSIGTHGAGASAHVGGRAGGRLAHRALAPDPACGHAGRCSGQAKGRRATARAHEAVVGQGQ